jgi:amino acid permease
MRDFLRELNRVMTRGHMVIRTRQQPDSPRERLRAQIIIALFLLAMLIGFVVAISEAIKR